MSQTISGEWERFRKSLESTKAELTHGRTGRDSLAIEPAPDELDRIQEAGDREAAVRNMERDTAKLREVRDALRRLDSDAFGICGVCDEPIALKRLLAVPWAALCLSCQEDQDRRLKESGLSAGSDAMAA